jgi:hypothetical protein
MYQGVFEVDAVTPGGPPKFVVSLINRGGKLLREEGISNRIQIDYGGHEESTNQKRRRQVRETIYANEIAYDLVNEWVKLPFGSSTECHPGVWVVRDRVPNSNDDGTPVLDADGRQDWRDATKEEQMAMWNEDLAANRSADSQYARKVFDYWDAQISKYPKMIEALPQMVRDAAKAYGWMVDWMRSTQAIETKICPFCDRAIRKQAILCPHQDCGQVVDYKRWAEQLALRQQALREAGVDPALINADPGALIVAGATGKSAGKAA